MKNLIFLLLRSRIFWGLLFLGLSALGVHFSKEDQEDITNIGTKAVEIIEQGQ